MRDEGGRGVMTECDILKISTSGRSKGRGFKSLLNTILDGDGVNMSKPSQDQLLYPNLDYTTTIKENIGS